MRQAGDELARRVPAVLIVRTRSVRAGAGIVADSVPAREYEETINKAQGMLTAIRVAEERFAGGS